MVLFLSFDFFFGVILFVYDSDVVRFVYFDVVFGVYGVVFVLEFGVVDVDDVVGVDFVVLVCVGVGKVVVY